MRISSLVPIAVSGCLLLLASNASAERIDPAGAATDMGSASGTSILNTINGVGLTAPTLTALHAGTRPGNSWVSAGGVRTGQVTFDLGTPYSLTGFSFWNQNAGGPGPAGSTGIQGVAVLYSTDGVSFVQLPGAPGAFAQVSATGPVGPERFSFPPVTASFVRFQITSNYGDVNNTGFAEVAFDGLSLLTHTAAYDAALKAPRCTGPAGECDSGALLVGRDSIIGGPEPNQPNTINDSCGDGTLGTFHVDESIDHLRIVTVDGGSFAPGKTVRILTTVWSFASDFLDLYYASDAATPSWTYLTTIIPADVRGLQTLSATYVLPAGATQAVRAVFRFGGSPSVCTSGVFDDHDDLVFGVGAAPGDFDGDAKADPTVFRPSTGGWFSLNSKTAYATSTGVLWGLSTDVPVPGDYDGDGKIDPAIFRPSTGLWAFLKSSTNYTTSATVSWGLSTDVPQAGDFDGDGKTDPAIFRPSTGLWSFLKSSTNFTTWGTVSWGLSTDVPLVGDYDGDGKADPAIWRPSTGLWAFLKSSTSFTSSGTVSWGLSTDVPVPGDYAGDGRIDPAVFRPSTGGWFVLKSSTSYTTSFGVFWGLSTDVAVPADYDGDGRTDPAIFRPSTGLWAVLKSSTSYTTSSTVSWGVSTDVPMNRRP
jgi:F5/8 type C domain-containing protein